MKTEKAIFAAGCFWGTQYHFDKQEGVVNTTVGYTGGTMTNPTHEKVIREDTGHREAIEVEFDPDVTSFEKLAKLFFEIHDFSQEDGQGPDLGYEYTSAIYYTNEKQKETAEQLIKKLEGDGYSVATEVVPAAEMFYPAKDIHQKFHEKNGTAPYCHIYVKKF